MKFKIMGIQTKFMVSALIAVILGYITAMVITPESKLHNYNSSTQVLINTMGNIELEINSPEQKNLESYKNIFDKYERRLANYKLSFLILDPDNKKVYSSGNMVQNFSLDEALRETFKNFSPNQSRSQYAIRKDITTAYTFACKFYIRMDNKPYTLWVTALPTPDAKFNPLFTMIVSTVVIFYIITLPRIRYIRKICSGLSKIASGDLDYKIPIKGKDELAGIAVNINSMSSQIKNKIEQEKEIELSKQELITNIAHDIRSPLTSIIGFLKIVENDEYKSEEEMKKYIGIAVKKSDTIKSLTDNLFIFTKLNSSSVKLNTSEVCLNELVYQLIDEFTPAFEAAELHITDDVTYEKLLVNIDVNIFMRAFNNLFYNAIKYSTKPSTVAISLSKGEGTAKFSIKNKCTPLTEHDVKMLFERFYRADKSRNKPGENSGLGLSIAKSIVEKHDGKIYAEYKDQEICFIIEIPLIPGKL